MKKYSSLIIGILFLFIHGNTFAGDAPVYNYSNTNGFSINGTINNNVIQGTFQNGVDDPVNYTATNAGDGRTDITTPNGTTSCESGVGCVGADAAVFNDALDSMNSSMATNGSESVSNDTSSNNILGLNDADLRNGNVDMDTIPRVIVNLINVLLGVAGTISIVALIYYAVQMQINSGITGDSSGVDNAKKGMRGALLGFALAILAWFIVIRFIELLTTVSA